MTPLPKSASSLADLFSAPRPVRYTGVECSSRYLPMPDGTQIAIDIMLPKGRESETRLPILMIMARYWRSMDLRVPDRPNRALIGPREPVADYLIGQGFGMVVVDGRGSGASTGVSRYPFMDEEIADYGIVAAWIAEQPWCNGCIGAFGISYEGATALRLASTGVAQVKAVVPQEIEFDVYADVAMPGGILNESFMHAWDESNRRLDAGKSSSLFPLLVRPLIKGIRPVDADRKTRALLMRALHEHQNNTNVFEAVRQITYRDDPFGTAGVTLDDFSVFARQTAIEQSEVSIFNWASWLDGASAEAALRTHNGLRNSQITVIGAWKHEMTAHGSPFQKIGAKPNPSQAEQWRALAQYFGQTLEAGQPLQDKTVFYYTLGEETWKCSDTFPLANTEMQTWYFQSGGGLAPHHPDDENQADTYTVDFEVTTGKTNRWNTQMAKPLIYRDRAVVDKRLLTYTSAPLTQDIEVTGYPVVTLHLTSSESDGAFFVYLEDIDPQGVVRYITEGQLRGIHRKLAETAPSYWTGLPYRTFKRADAAPLPRGEFVTLTFGLQPTSALFRAGHRIRVALAGADRDTFTRIPAVGTPVWQVGRGGIHASAILLPVVH